MVCFYLLAVFLNPFISLEVARQSIAQRGHGKSLSERLSASLWREIIWKWGKGHLWNEVRFSLKEKKKRERGITRSGCDLSKVRRSPRAQRRGRGDPKDWFHLRLWLPYYNSLYLIIHLDAMPSASDASLYAVEISHEAPDLPRRKPQRAPKGRRIHLQGNIIICDLAWDHLSRIVCTQSRGNFFPACMQLRQGGKREYDLDPADATGSFISRTPCRLWGSPCVNIFSLFHSEVPASRLRKKTGPGQE